MVDLIAEANAKLAGLNAAADQYRQQLTTLQQQGVVWNDAAYQAVQQKYNETTAQIAPAYQYSKDLQNLMYGITGSSGPGGPMQTGGSNALNASDLQTKVGVVSVGQDVGGVRGNVSFASQGGYVPTTNRVDSGAVGPTVTSSVAPQVAQNQRSAGADIGSPFMNPQNPSQPVQNQQAFADIMSRAVTKEAPGTTYAYAPYGNYMQTEIANAKIGLSPAGEIGIYQNLGRNEAGAQRLAVNPETGSLDPFILIGGGGRAAAQSGTFSTSALSPVAVEQWSGKYIKPQFISPQAAKSTATSEEIIGAALSGKPYYDIGLSRLGAEAYGGAVTRLDSRALGNIQYGQFPTDSGNLALYVNPQGANIGKASLPGAAIPWSISGKESTIFGIDQSGIMPGVGVNLKEREISPTQYIAGFEGRSAFTDRAGGASVSQPMLAETSFLNTPTKSGSTLATGLPQEGRLVGGGKVASIATTVETPLTKWEDVKGRLTPTQQSMVEFGLKTSRSAAEDFFAPVTETTTVKPQSGALPFLGVVPVASDILKTFEPTEKTTVYKKGNQEYTVTTPGETPFTMAVQKVAPSIESGESAMTILDRVYQIGPLGTNFAMSRDIGTGAVTLGAESLGYKQQAETIKSNAEFSNAITSPFIGQYKMAYENPALSGVSFASMGLLGGGVRGVSALASRSETLMKAAPLVEKAAPYVGYGLGALYGGQVSFEQTKGFTNITPASVASIKARGTQEGIPGGIGFGVGYYSPEIASSIYGGAKGIASRGVSLIDTKFYEMQQRQMGIERLPTTGGRAPMIDNEAGMFSFGGSRPSLPEPMRAPGIENFRTQPYKPTLEEAKAFIKERYPGSDVGTYLTGRTTPKLEPVASTGKEAKFLVTESIGRGIIPEGTTLTSGAAKPLRFQSLYYESAIRPQFVGKYERTYGRPLEDLPQYKEGTPAERRMMRETERTSMSEAEKAYRKVGSFGGITGNVFSPKSGSFRSRGNEFEFSVSSGMSGAGNQQLMLKSTMDILGTRPMSAAKRRAMALAEEEDYLSSVASIRPQKASAQSTAMATVQRPGQISESPFARYPSQRESINTAISRANENRFGISQRQSIKQELALSTKQRTMLETRPLNVPRFESITTPRTTPFTVTTPRNSQRISTAMDIRTITGVTQVTTPQTTQITIPRTRVPFEPRFGITTIPRMPTTTIPGFSTGYGSTSSPALSKQYRGRREVIPLMSQLFGNF